MIGESNEEKKQGRDLYLYGFELVEVFGASLGFSVVLLSTHSLSTCK